MEQLVSLSSVSFSDHTCLMMMSVILKINSSFFPVSRLVLRITTDDSKAVCRLSVKFGATLKTSRLLLERAKELDLAIVGVR